MRLRRREGSDPNAGPRTEVRVEGSLEGKAPLGEDAAVCLTAAVEALSKARPYRFDLEFTLKGFSIILMEPTLSFDSLKPDPPSALGRDLQQILDSLPPTDRLTVQCTFRALWNEGGETQALAFRVNEKGGIEALRKIIPQENQALLRTAEGQKQVRRNGGSPLPRWALILLVLAAAAAAVYLVLLRGPWRSFL